MDTSRFSIEKLIRLAYQGGLVSDYRMTPSRVELYRQGRSTLVFDPEEARLFLQGLIRGYQEYVHRVGFMPMPEQSRAAA
ncbi:MAG TPA: hypothetical protein VFG50_11480 [Rhodothermales bacterium]|nr:hypothetical protein [Rhodothermales bacterium]